MEPLKHLEALVAAQLSVIRSVFSVFRLEARLAGLSVYPLLLNTCLLFAVLITLWLFTMLLAGYFVLLKTQSIPLSLVFVILIHIVLLFGLLKCLSCNLNNLSFLKTREYLSGVRNNDYESLEKEDNSADCSDGPKTAMPTKQSNEA